MRLRTFFALALAAFAAGLLGAGWNAVSGVFAQTPPRLVIFEAFNSPG